MKTADGRRPLIAVVGGASASPRVLAEAASLGCLLVDAGARIVTGGLGGVMEAASRGARSSPAWRDGDVLGILPGHDPAAANPWVDVPLATGLHHARNALVVTMADAVVAVAGGAGTLSEVALAWQLGRLVVALDVGEGWSSRLAGTALDDRREDQLHRATHASEAVALLRELLPRHTRRSLGF